MILSSLRTAPAVRPSFRRIAKRLQVLRDEIECVEPCVVSRDAWVPLAPLINEQGQFYFSFVPYE